MTEIQPDIRIDQANPEGVEIHVSHPSIAWEFIFLGRPEGRVTLIGTRPAKEKVAEPEDRPFASETMMASDHAQQAWEEIQKGE